jgi:hypothetical protein
VNADNNDSCIYRKNEAVRIYPIIIQDSPSQLFTMRQSNNNYLSAYRLFARGSNNAIENKYLLDIIQLSITGLFFMPLTHEEGHRSILTTNNIGSISQPYFNGDGAAYVKGVTDQTLQNLRDNNLPSYIRLHTAGLESDYMLTKRVEAICSFEQDEFKNLNWEYWIRKYSIIQYYAMGLIKYEIDLEEEKDELERDIVGHDLYGAARHLYRPTMKFYRYTNYANLTSEEQSFIKRIGYRSFLNLLNPLIIGKNNFKLSKTTKINIGMGYTMSPFGDFIDENIWVKYRALNIGFYARQFQNKNNWFNGFGLSVNDYTFKDKLSLSIATHFWQQPLDYDFNTSKYFVGGAIDVDIRYWFPLMNSNGISLDLGMIYKTKGFLPEEVYLSEHFGIRIGTSIKL